MKNHYAKKLFLIAFLVLAATNLFVLFGVYTNRSGEPQSTLILTERELQAPYQISEENSGLALNIIWRSLGKKNEHQRFRSWYTPQWLDAEKLRSLGFDIDSFIDKEYNDEYYHAYSSTKECFIVLEYNAEAYNTLLEEVLEELKVQEDALKSDPDNKATQDLYKSEKARLQSVQNYDTRLYAIDAGTDPQVLRENYSDGSKYIITKAQIRASYIHDTKEVNGFISRLSVVQVHVPTKFRQVIDPILHYKQKSGTSFRTHDITTSHAPRYKVTIAYGKRYEPWIVSIEPFKK
ncbi:DUF4824 family protein [Sulfurovum sp. zt1-1]|uniref:DUF4824 family protein n=1 Tax=Sulfurovum zhangzhouensis TaxID=3019067 RepID=A0ABT7QYI2_9BACT|nr:DUF4824 family protein [Sulfurovum zhangzhouensis]MDM5271902.1 DUF4824 family protein [Sulfurovum zhangzhouensis]